MKIHGLAKGKGKQGGKSKSQPMAALNFASSELRALHKKDRPGIAQRRRMQFRKNNFARAAAIRLKNNF